MPKRFLAFMLCLLPLGVQASPIEMALPDAQVRGESTFRYVGIPIYNARLYTASGGPLDWQDDFALELTYLRRFSQKDLVNSTLQEFTRVGTALPVRKDLSGCFIDVARGDRYLAISDGPNEVSFWHNGNKTCNLRYPNIKARFMGIFLGDNSRSRTFTQRLLGK